MMSISLVAFVISLILTIVTQLLHLMGIVSADGRNMVLSAFMIWLIIACVIFIIGIVSILKATINVTL